MAMNMKSSSCLYYVFLLLIFLLLVDKSHSANSKSETISKLIERLNPKLEKFEIIRDFPVDELVKKYKDQLKKLSGRRPLPFQVPGLNVIKRYLSDYGYLESSGPYNDTLDNDTASAIKAYQQFFKLQDTGLPNIQTVQLMSLPRCGTPDVNFEYNLDGKHDVSLPKAGNWWFPKGTKNLSYFLGSEIPRNTTKVFRNAFARWANATTVLNLTETKTKDEADIIVDFYIFNSNEVGSEVVGGAIIRLKKGSNVTIGQVILDGSLDWVPPAKSDTVLSSKDGVFDLETVVMHQIGHLLGLDHSHKNDSIMYPTILPNQQRKVELSNEDKDAILKYYTTTTTATTTESNSLSNSGHGGPFTLFKSSWDLITTLSLGFACMVLLY